MVMWPIGYTPWALFSESPKDVTIPGDLSLVHTNIPIRVVSSQHHFWLVGAHAVYIIKYFEQSLWYLWYRIFWESKQIVSIKFQYLIPSVQLLLLCNIQHISSCRYTCKCKLYLCFFFKTWRLLWVSENNNYPHTDT